MIFIYLTHKINILNPFQLGVAFHTEASHLICKASHLICTANQMTGLYMKCNTVLKWVKLVKISIRVSHLVRFLQSWFLLWTVFIQRNLYQTQSTSKLFQFLNSPTRWVTLWFYFKQHISSKN